MRQIAARRSGADALLIYVQQKLAIGADVYQKVRGGLGKIQNFAEVEYEGVTLGLAGAGDPLRGPGFTQKIGGDLGRQERADRKKEQG